MFEKSILYLPLDSRSLILVFTYLDQTIDYPKFVLDITKKDSITQTRWGSNVEEILIRCLAVLFLR